MSATRPGPEPGEMEYLSTYLDSCEEPFLELACGYGRLLLPILERGHRIVGTDASPDMLNRCRRLSSARGLAPELHEQFMQRLELNEQFGLIFIDDCTFTLVITDDDARELFARVFDHLKPGGSFLFDFFAVDTDKPGSHGELTTGWAQVDDRSVFVGRKISSYDPDTQVTTQLQIHGRRLSRKMTGRPVSGYAVSVTMRIRLVSHHAEPKYGSKVKTKVTVTYLEMTDKHQLRPPNRRCSYEYSLTRAEIPCPELNRFLYAAVGADWMWQSRIEWTYTRWMEYLDRPEVETWIAYVKGTPAGYFELERQEHGNVELVYFGIMPKFTGGGLGGALLTDAVQRAWELGVTRVWVHTCTLDHPAALANYKARGFTVYESVVEHEDLPEGRLEPWPGARRPPVDQITAFQEP